MASRRPVVPRSRVLRRPVPRRAVRRSQAAGTQAADSPAARNPAGSLARPAVARLVAAARLAMAAARPGAGHQSPVAGRAAAIALRRAWHGVHAALRTVPIGPAAPVFLVASIWLAARAMEARRPHGRPADPGRRSRKRPRSQPDGHAGHTAVMRQARHSHRPAPRARPAGRRRCPPSRRWTDRYASRCRHKAARCTSPARRSSRALPAGLPGVTRRSRRTGQTRGWSSVSSIPVRAFRPLPAQCAQP
jgi:hypothetical protein